MYKCHYDKSIHNLHLRLEKKEYELYIFPTVWNIKSHTDVDQNNYLQEKVCRHSFVLLGQVVTVTLRKGLVIKVFIVSDNVDPLLGEGVNTKTPYLLLSYLVSVS